MFMKSIGQFFGAKIADLPKARNTPGSTCTTDSAPSSDPTPLPSYQPSGVPFPVNSVSPRVRQAVQAIQRIIQAPEALAAQAVLGAVSLSVSSLALVQAMVPNATHPVALSLIAIAESGERKSAVDAQAMGGILMLIDQNLKEYRAELDKYRSEMDGRGRGDPKPEKPTLPLFLANEPTIEGLLRMIDGGPGFAGLFTDEGSVFFGGYSMSRDQRMKTAGILSKLWDYIAISRPRASAEAVSMVASCPTTVNLMIQPVVLENSYNDDFLVGQGLLARMLPTWPPSNIGNRPYREASKEDLDTVADFQARTRALVKQAITNPPKMRVLGLGKPSRASIRVFHDDVEAKMRPGGEYDDIRGFAAKGAEHALRLAGVMTLFEEPDAANIDLACLEGAQELVRFYLEEFRHIRAVAKSDPLMAQADELREWLLQRVGAGKPFARELVQQRGPAGVRRNETLNKVLKALVDYGWIQRLPAGSKVDGKARKEAFSVHPRANQAPTRAQYRWDPEQSVRTVSPAQPEV